MWICEKIALEPPRLSFVLVLPFQVTCAYSRIFLKKKTALEPPVLFLPFQVTVLIPGQGKNWLVSNDSFLSILTRNGSR